MGSRSGPDRPQKVIAPMPELPRDPGYFIDKLRELQAAIRDTMVTQRERSSEGAMREMHEVSQSDIIYSTDAWAHLAVTTFCEQWAQEYPFLLVAEGVGSGREPLPAGTPERDCLFVLIIDPVDGTRGLMYDKRAGWALSAVAPYRGDATSMRDVEVAVQTSLPMTSQFISTVMYAARGCGASGEHHNLFSGAVTPFVPRPASDERLTHGFASIVKFFARGKSLAGEIEERLMEALTRETGEQFPKIFDDQYMTSGGQLHELAVGHDLFNADLRPLLFAQAGDASQLGRICAHPYDVCTELIAREAGVVVTDVTGEPLSVPLDVTTNVAWLGFANEAICAQVFPVLREILADLRLL
jgi:fructose-1,6-bisphosphatase/inositol monophosphatase family enzyme